MNNLKLNNQFIILLSIISIGFYYSCKSLKQIIDNTSNENIFKVSTHDSNRLASYNGDTIAYINYLYKNQAKYLGKPLSILLNDLDFKIHQFGYVTTNKRDGKVYNIILKANPYGENGPLDASGINQNMELGVGLQPYIFYDSIKKITSENGAPNYVNWSKNAEAYFGKKIVGNLWLIII